MPTAGEQIGKTIVKLTQENADLSREVERLTRATQLASELIEYNQTLAQLRVAEGAVREEPYGRLPTLVGTLKIAAMQFEQLRDENKRLQSHAKNAERAALNLKAKLEVEIERLESIIESLRGGTHCRFVGVPCGQCVGCNRDASVEKKIRVRG